MEPELDQLVRPPSLALFRHSRPEGKHCLSCCIASASLHLENVANFMAALMNSDYDGKVLVE